MKKLLALLLSLLMVFSMATLLSSCGKSDDDDDDTSSSVSKDKDEDEDEDDDDDEDEDDDIDIEDDDDDVDIDDDDSDFSIVGKWETTVNMIDFLAAGGEDFEFDTSGVKNTNVKLLYDFKGDGTVVVRYDEKTFKKFLRSYLEVYFESELDDSDEIAEAIESEMDNFSDEDLIADECEYEVQGNRFALMDDGSVSAIYTFKSVNNNKFKITKIEDEDGNDFSSILPMVFEKA